MSQNAFQLRLRSARHGEESLRQRLALVPPRAVQATRIPFVALVALILTGGVAGLLLFNTHLQQGAFEIERLQAQASVLSAQQQDQDMALLQLNDPQHLAEAATKLGMVVPPNPAFLDLATGKILGVPAAATAGDTINIGASSVAPTPASLRPAPKIVIVQPSSTGAKTSQKKGAAATKSTSTAKTKGGTGASSKVSGASTGKNG